MGVYITGMEMPKSCRDCRFCNGQANTDYGVCAWCDVDGKARDAYTMQNCPLVPVPPHGRLGDLDALRKRIEENIYAAKKAGNYEWWYACTVALDFALAAPAVIVAEEGE